MVLAAAAQLLVTILLPSRKAAHTVSRAEAMESLGA
jgi:hypothetical protein